jgi:hypothetical protein
MPEPDSAGQGVQRQQGPSGCRSRRREARYEPWPMPARLPAYRETTSRFTRFRKRSLKGCVPNSSTSSCHRSFDRLKVFLSADLRQYGQEDFAGVRPADDGGEHQSALLIRRIGFLKSNSTVTERLRCSTQPGRLTFGLGMVCHLRRSFPRSPKPSLS